MIYSSTAGNDTIYAVRNVTVNTIDGGAGVDTLWIDQMRQTNYTISGPDANGVTTLSGASGSTFSLTNVEFVYFQGSKTTYTVPTDTAPPTVSAFSPAPAATGVAVASNIVATFSEVVQRGTGSIVLTNAAGAIIETFDAATSLLLTISGATLTINPTSNLANGTNYYVTFASGTIKDLIGNAYAGSTTYNFTTNYVPTGSVDISGTVAQGQILTAINNFADTDGLGAVSYQWKAGGTNIAGATGATYLLTQAEVGQAISVVVNYTDLRGTAESVASNSLNVSAPVTTSSTTTSRYTLLGTGTNLMDFYLPYGNLSLDGQNIVFKGNSGIDSVYVGNAAGLSFDFTQAGLGVDQIYLSGRWADYSRSYSGSVVTLIRTNGGSEIIKTFSGDSLVFADGTVPVLSALNFLKGTVAEPVPDSGATSTAFPMTAATPLSNTVRAVVQDASGETIALARPGVAMTVKGGSGVDVVYVTSGASVDGTQLGLGQDKLYLTGNWADYNGTYAGAVVTLTQTVGADTETVKFLGGSASAYDSIIFADGTASSIDILNYLKAPTTTPQPALNTTEVTPLGTGDIVTGTTGIDLLNGTAAGDTLYGSGGADTINGAAGNDTIIISDTGTTAGNSASIVFTLTAHGTDTIIGFSATPVANGGDVLDFSAIANLTDVVATGQTLTTDFAANNVFIFDGTPVTIVDAANAIAADVSVVATNGYIVIADSANHNAVTVYHSTDLAANGAETALAILSGVNITSLTAANFLV